MNIAINNTYAAIPEELKQLKNWVCCKAEYNAENGKISKKPVNPLTGGFARSNDPSTWSDFNTALKQSEHYSGIGFMFGESDYFGVDIDGVEQEIDDYLHRGKSNIVSEFITSLNTYTERSLSGKGIHLICKGTLPTGGRRHGNVEMYEDGRFFVMTGDMISAPQIRDCTEAIKPLHNKYIGRSYSANSAGVTVRQRTNPRGYQPSPPSAEDMKTILSIVKKAVLSKNGDHFADLLLGKIDNYPSHSEADYALCRILSFWCRRDPVLIDKIFRISKLYRPKWDSPRGSGTYGSLTITNACNRTYEVYNGTYT